MSSLDAHHAFIDKLNALQEHITRENEEMEKVLRERKEAALAKREHYRELARQEEQKLREEKKAALAKREHYRELARNEEKRRAQDRQDIIDLSSAFRMGNLHSAITERVQQRVGQLFYKDWFSKLLLRFRQIRDELAGKMYNFWQMLQFQQEPAQRPISSGPTTRSGRSLDDVYRNPNSFGLYHDQIEVYNNNEMKLVYFVCGINLVLFALLIRYLFI